ncbi:hypothetical protein HK405_004490 [Cladochytrium tenue]|nr:hypothetical protein HK405_004490 [Cladochytrium tenue]
MSLRIVHLVAVAIDRKADASPIVPEELPRVREGAPVPTVYSMVSPHQLPDSGIPGKRVSFSTVKMESDKNLCVRDGDNGLKHLANVVRGEIIKKYTIIEDVTVGVVGDNGAIEAVVPHPSAASAEILSSADAPPVTYLPPGAFLLPAFVDLHLHSAQYLYAGTGLDLPLMPWLAKHAYAAELRVDTDPRLAVELYTALAHRLVREGIAAVLAFGTIGVDANLTLARCLLRAGLRGFVGKVSMDASANAEYVEKSSHDAAEAARLFVTELRRKAPEWAAEMAAVHGAGDDAPDPDLVQPVLTPRFVPTCSDDLLVALRRLSDELGGVLVQSHLCESADQIALVREIRQGRDDEAVFRAAGLLFPRTVMAHVTYLTPVLAEELGKTRTAIAHCPISNAFFSDVQFPLREAIDHDLRIGLGSDVAGGYDLSIHTQMRQSVITARLREGRRRELEAVLTEKSKRLEPASKPSASLDSQSGWKKPPSDLRVGWKEALYLATRGGAEALGLHTGQFVIGAPFDAQLIRLLGEDGQSGLGRLDFVGTGPPPPPPEDYVEGTNVPPTEESWRAWWTFAIERWWSAGDERNRAGLWVNGRDVWQH